MKSTPKCTPKVVKCMVNGGEVKGYANGSFVEKLRTKVLDTIMPDVNAPTAAGKAREIAGGTSRRAKQIETGSSRLNEDE